MSPQLRINLFGSPQIWYRGEPLPLKVPPKTIPLWAYLLLHRFQAVSRQALAFALWPDTPEKAARANVRRHLFLLKSALPAVEDPAWLLQDAQTVQWNPQANYWLDVAEFERLGQDPAGAEEAVALYRGDLLENCYDDWIFPERERLRNLYMVNLTRLVDHYRARRAFPQAIAFAVRLLALDPLREDALRLLITLRYESGDRAGALKEYTAFCRLLREELGGEPMPETQALADAIRRNRLVFGAARDGQLEDASSTAARHAAAAGRRASLVLPFVGRETELEQLLSWWDRAARGVGTLVMIGGEAGVGKTRLVEEFARRVEAQGGRMLLGHALATEAAPYQPVASALRNALPLLAALDLSPLWQAVVTQVLPELGTRRGSQAAPLPELPALDPEREQMRLFEGLFHCLSGLARPRPLALILEDLHWAGAGTAGLLAFIARRLGSHPLLVIGTYRQEAVAAAHPLAAIRRPLQRDRLWQPLALGRLPQEAVQELVGRLFQQEDDVADLAGRLFGASEGNPLFLQELIRDLMDRGSIRVEAGRWQLGPLDDLAVAPGAQGAIAGRLQRLSPQARRLAEVAAVVGPAFEFDLLHQASGWSEREVLDCVDELLDCQLVREAGRGGAFDYAFSHHLVQAAIYEASPSAQRARRHRRLAGLLAARAGPPAEVARHYDLGGEPGRAAEFYLQAAHGALALRADDEALQALARGLALAQDPGLRLQLLCEQDNILHRRGDRPRQAACLADLAELANRRDEEEWRCEALRRRIRYHRALGEREMEGRWVLALKQRAAASGDPRWQAEAWRTEATSLALLGRYAEAVASLEQAIPLYETLADAAGLMACHCQLAEITVHQSRFDEAQTHLQAASALAQAHRDQTLLVRALRTASGAAFAHQNYAESQALGRQLLELCREIGDREGEADAHSRLATVAARLFRVEEAHQHYGRAAELYERIGKRQGQAAVSLNTGMLAVNLGRYEAGIASFRQAESLFEALADPRGLAVSALNQSAAAIYQGNWTVAEQAARRAYELAHGLGLAFLEATALGNLGEVALNRGELLEAVDALRRSLALRQQTGQAPGDAATDLSLLALALLRLGDKTAARQAADELVALCESTPDTVPYPQQALWAAAQVHRGLGDRPRAARLLARAHGVLEERAAAIPDPESRDAFRQIPFHRKIQQAWEEDIWPDSPE